MLQDIGDIDWQSLWKELDWDDETRHAESEKRRLAQRAQQYATLIAEAESGVEAERVSSVLVFRLGDELYAINVLLIQTVRPISRVTPVPGTSPFYLGVVNIRGQIVTVIDLRHFFDMEVDTNDPPQELIVVQAGGLQLAVLAHKVQDVVVVPDSAIDPIDDVRYARGMTASRVMVLDAARLFEDERLIIGSGDE